MDDIIKSIFSPEIPISLQEIGTIVLPVTGTLLGLIYTGLIYWLESGFARLNYIAEELEYSVIADGRVLLDLLVGATVVSLFTVIKSEFFVAISFWFFCFGFLRDLKKSLHEFRYLNRVFKLQYPKYVFALRVFFFTIPITYPILVNLYAGSFLLLTDIATKCYLIFSTIFAVIQIRSLLTQAFKTRRDLKETSRRS